MVKKRGKTNKDVYEKVEDLPESRKERLDSILEDFDKEGEQILDILDADFIYFKIYQFPSEPRKDQF